MVGAPYNLLKAPVPATLHFSLSLAYPSGDNLCPSEQTSATYVSFLGGHIAHPSEHLSTVQFPLVRLAINLGFICYYLLPALHYPIVPSSSIYLARVPGSRSDIHPFDSICTQMGM